MTAIRFFFNALMLVAVTAVIVHVEASPDVKSEVAGIEPLVIYGEDGRKDIYEEPSIIKRRLARSTVAIITDEHLDRLPTGNFKPVGVTYAQEAGLCPGEPFSNQIVLADCSGFLIASDLILTAGHCVPEVGTCQSLHFVFDFALDSKTGSVREFPKDKVFACKEVVSWSSRVAPLSDFAVLKLDRPVVGREPVRLNMKPTLKTGDQLYVIGHPFGLPTKITSGGKVRAIEHGTFKASLDTFAGNSGSPVFNEKTGEVEGILVAGERDFEYKNQCTVEYACAEDDCEGEDSVAIHSIANHLPLKPKFQTSR